MSKGCLMTSYPPSWRALADVVCPVQAKFAAAHGMDYVADCSDVQSRVTSAMIGPKPTAYAPMGVMIKFPLLLHYLTPESCRQAYDYVCWADIDWLPTRFDLPLTTWISNKPKDHEGTTPLTSYGDIVLPYDVNGVHPTLIGIRNTVLTRGYMWALTEAGHRLFFGHEWADNLSQRFLLGSPPYRDLVRWVSAKVLCAMHPNTYPIPADVRACYEWDETSLGVHLSAMTLPQRVEIATEYIERLGLLR